MRSKGYKSNLLNIEKYAFFIYFLSLGKTTFSNPQISEKKLRTSVTSSNRKKTCKETHRIRVFVLETDQQIPKARSTERYQTIMKMVQSKTFTSVTEEEQQDLQRGYLGPCLLTNLTFFDQGQSFLSDSLHTLYGGAMVIYLLVFSLIDYYLIKLYDLYYYRKSYYHFGLIENGALRRSHGLLNQEYQKFLNF